MAYTINTGETPEEIDARRRARARKRARNIFIVLVITVIARFVVKDPKPPKRTDHSKARIEIVPGMLDALPAASRDRLDPLLVARMQYADEQARLAKLQGPTVLAQNTRPIDDKNKFFTLEKRHRHMLALREPSEPRDITKTILVMFRGGGYIKAEKAQTLSHHVEIRIDKTILAAVPQTLVESVTDDALTWEEPVPKGCVRLKPAKGITITLNRETAKRISVRKHDTDDI